MVTSFFYSLLPYSLERWLLSFEIYPGLEGDDGLLDGSLGGFDMFDYFDHSDDDEVDDYYEDDNEEDLGDPTIELRKISNSTVAAAEPLQVISP